MFVCNAHELWSWNDLWSRRLLRESCPISAVLGLIRRVITTLPKLPRLDLRNVNKEKQQQVKQLLDSHSARTVGQLVRYQVEMKGLTRYVYLSYDLFESADESVYRCIQRARVLRRMYVRTVLRCECYSRTGVSHCTDRLDHLLKFQLFNDAECHKRRIHLR